MLQSEKREQKKLFITAAKCSKSFFIPLHTNSQCLSTFFTPRPLESWKILFINFIVFIPLFLTLMICDSTNCSINHDFFYSCVWLKFEIKTIKIVTILIRRFANSQNDNSLWLQAKTHKIKTLQETLESKWINVTKLSFDIIYCGSSDWGPHTILPSSKIFHFIPVKKLTKPSITLIYWFLSNFFIVANLKSKENYCKVLTLM